MHFSRKISLFASLLEMVRHFRNILVFLVSIEEKLDVDVLAIDVARHYIVVCHRSAAGMTAELYRGDRVVVGNIGNSNKLTKS